MSGERKRARHGVMLPLRVAWPLLLLNAIDWFVAEDDSYVSSYRTGDTWHVPVPAGASEATIVDPSGGRHRVPVSDGRAVYAGMHAGFHTLVTSGGEETFAANLGAEIESDVAPARELTLSAVGEATGRAAVPASDAAKNECAGDQFMDGHAFDPSDIPNYVAAFPVKSGISARFPVAEA